jgi:hypothetical protein
MKTLDPDILAQLDAGRIDRRDALIFILDEGVFGFFAGGRGTLTFNVGGIDVDFVGSGSLIDISMQQDDVQQTHSSIEVSLCSMYEVDGELREIISADLLVGIEQLSWYRRPAIVGRLWINDAGGIIDFEQLARCEIHDVAHVEDDEKGYTLTGVLETVDVFRQLVDAKTANTEFQQSTVDATDRGFDHVSRMATDQVFWGRKDPAVVEAEKNSKKKRR